MMLDKLLERFAEILATKLAAELATELESKFATLPEDVAAAVRNEFSDVIQHFTAGFTGLPGKLADTVDQVINGKVSQIPQQIIDGVLAGLHIPNIFKSRRP